MKCALHVHTIMSDGSMTVSRALSIYREKGFGCVAITDHDFMVPADYRETIKTADSLGMVLIDGVELEHAPWRYHHVLELKGGNESFHAICHPGAYGLSVEEVKTRIADPPFPIDAIEITYRGILTSQYDVPEIPVPKIATDDAHDVSDCGRAWIEMDDTRDPGSILRAVKAGEFENVFTAEPDNRGKPPMGFF